MLNVYKVTSENISGLVAQSGEEILKQPLLKQMRAVKREILTLISTWVGKTQDANVRFLTGNNRTKILRIDTVDEIDGSQSMVLS